MTDNNLTQKDKLPLATAKTKDGVELYWVEELQVAGIHVRGIMQLLQSESDLVHNVITSLEGVRQITILETETITPGGLQGVRLVTESDLPKVLRKIERSKAKESVRDLAGDIRDKLAAAGFKLLVMMELAPEQLAGQSAQRAKAIDGDRVQQLEAEVAELKEAIVRQVIAGSKRSIAGTQPTPMPQTIDSVDELSEVRRRRNLAEMEAACTPGTEEYKSAIAVRDWLNRN